MRTIFTIGYEGASIEPFVADLVSAGIEVLADVRAVTVSRKKGFSKNGLRARLAEAGITYVHFRDLGDPKPGREAARAGRYPEFRAIYGTHLRSPEAKSALSALARVVIDRRTCLMCYERDASVCHRSIVAEAVSKGSASISNLSASVTERSENAAVRKGNYSRQSATAAE